MLMVQHQLTEPSRVVDRGRRGDGKAAAAAAAARSRPKDAFEQEMELLAQRQQEEEEVTTTIAPAHRTEPSLMRGVLLSVRLQRKKVMSAQAQRNDKMARQAYQVPPLSPYLGPYLGPYLAFPTWLSLPGASPLPSPFPSLPADSPLLCDRCNVRASPVM